jgi:hypothetical protein
MNFKEQYNDELLRSYIGNDHEEAVPEGFTTKVMSRIQLEKIPTPARRRLNLVPVVSAAITALLSGIALIIPESDNMTFPGGELLNRINMKLPELKTNFFTDLRFPPVLYYVVIGVLVLAIFDKAFTGSVRHRRSA